MYIMKLSEPSRVSLLGEIMQDNVESATTFIDFETFMLEFGAFEIDFYDSIKRIRVLQVARKAFIIFNEMPGHAGKRVVFSHIK